MSYKKHKYLICQNCGRRGHHVKLCRDSITSIGIILYIKKKKNIKYLMICRRNSIGFVEFMRGRYAYSDTNYIQKLINVMSISEVNNLVNNTFENLWEILWLDNKFEKKKKKKKKKNKIKRDFNYARDKFFKLKNGYAVNNRQFNLDFFIKEKKTNYIEPEWGFPKGRRNNGETNIQTAIREFKEETSLNNNKYIFDLNKIFTEEYKSYDNVQYKNIYYLAKYIGDDEEFKIDSTKKEQFSEISKIKFYNYEDSINLIRDYNLEKKEILKSVHDYLKIK